MLQALLYIQMKVIYRPPLQFDRTFYTYIIL